MPNFISQLALRQLWGLALSLVLAASAGACGPYKLGYYAYGRLYFTDPQGEPAGIDVDVVKELARRTGCVFEPVLESRVRIWDQLQRGQLALTVSGSPTPEREAYAEFAPYAQARYFVLMRRERAAQVPSMAAFRADENLRVAVVKGYKHGVTLDAWLAALRLQGRVSEAGDFAAVVRLMQNGRVDAILALPEAWPDARHAFYDPSDLSTLDWGPRDRAVGALVMSRSLVSEPDRRRLRVAVAAMLRDGSVLRILRKYMPEDAARAAVYRPLAPD